MRFVYFLFILAIFFRSYPSHSVSCEDVFNDKVQETSQTSGEHEVLAEALTDLFDMIENQYGPLGLKTESIGLNWEQTKQEFQAKMSKVTNTSDALFLMAQLLHRLNDAHVVVKLPTTLTFSLPLQFAYAPDQDMIFLNYLELGNYPAGRPVPTIGDELIAINGMSPEEYMAKKSSYNAIGNPLTNKSNFAISLSYVQERVGATLLDESNPEVEFTFRSREGSGIYKVPLKYEVSGIGLKGYELTGGTDGLLEPLRRALRRMHDSSKNNEAEEAEKAREKTRGFWKTLIHAALPEQKERNVAEKWLNEILQLEESSRLVKQVHQLVNLETPTVFGKDNLATSKSSKPGAKAIGSPVELGRTKPMLKLPENFQRIRPPAVLREYLNDSSLFAGTFERDGKRVGYLRIPSYSPDNIDTALHSIRYFVGQLEQKSDYLILDQLNNPGGYVSYSDWIIQAFVGELDLKKHMKFAVKPTQGWLENFEGLIYEVNQLHQKGLLSSTEVREYEDVLWPSLQKVARLLDPKFKNGDDHTQLEKWGVSEPVPLVLFSEISQKISDRTAWAFFGNSQNPQLGYSVWYYAQKFLGVDIFSPQVYTKPVYMLINELDFSGGDATPANLQDYDRAKLIGVRTAGAGGSVSNFDYHEKGILEFLFSLTASLMVRENPEQPFVENYGVHPDIHFSLTREDFIWGFDQTLDRILKLIDEDRE